MATPRYNTYVGMRYVPIFDGEWSRTKTYEPLTIVSNQGNSYTSRTFVPTGVDINNTEYWALTGNYNAQVEYYRQETARVAEEVTSRVKEYNTVSDMINDADAEDGFVGKTLGYYTVNDGGGAYYNITETEPEGYYEELDNGLYAELIIGDNINVKQFGAKGDNDHDDTDAFIAAFAEAERRVYTKDFSDYTPSQQIGGVIVFIPDGKYKLNSAIPVATNIYVKGTGKNNSILIFHSTYGLSLKGGSYNGLRYWRGIIENIRISMSGSGIGISNIEYSDGTATNQNAVENSIFRNIKIANANVGFAMIGGWNNRLEKIECEVCNYGYILGRLSGVNGNNNNSIVQSTAISCKACGFWLDSSGLYMENINTEGIGNTWQGVYDGETVSILGTTYSVSNPCGIYFTGKSRAELHSFWCERITKIDTLECIAILINTATLTNNLPDGKISIYNSYFNADIYSPIKIVSACEFNIKKCYWPTAAGNETYFCYITETTYGTYTFDDIPFYICDNVVVENKTTFNSVLFRNVRTAGSGGNYDKYVFEKDQNYNTLTRTFFKHTNTAYDVDERDIVVTVDSSITKQVNGTNVAKYHYGNNQQRISFPQNVKVVNVTGGTNTVTVNSPVTYHGATAPAGIILTARDAVGAALLAGGYYWSGQGSGTVTITFVNTPSANCVLDALIFD